jgi:hypothetical protein
MQHNKIELHLNTSEEEKTRSEEETLSPTIYFVQHVVLTKMLKWGKLQNYGAPMDDLHGIIPMKTPIADKYIEGKHWNSFTIHDFVQEQWSNHGRLVGLMIDLSNHDCIYDFENVHVPVHSLSAIAPALSHNDFKREHGHDYMTLRYIKHRCISKMCPTRDNIDKFTEIVLNFKKNHPRHYIGVHCSYGFNRTGFVVCSFMIEQCGLSVDDAVQLFASSRKPGIKHKWFVDELRKRYEPKEEEEVSEQEDKPSENDGTSEEKDLSERFDYSCSVTDLPNHDASVTV